MKIYYIAEIVGFILEVRPCTILQGVNGRDDDPCVYIEFVGGSRTFTSREKLADSPEQAVKILQNSLIEKLLTTLKPIRFM